jgi:spermidine/putrescine transport system permease protein
MAGFLPKSGAESTGYRGIVAPLLVPTWVMIGIFLVIPVILMGIYSFLTKEFRGGVIWDFTLAAYDQFFVTRGLFGDEPTQIEWTYINIFWRSIWQAGIATLVCVIVGFPTAWFIATRPPATRSTRGR